MYPLPSRNHVDPATVTRYRTPKDTAMQRYFIRTIGADTPAPAYFVIDSHDDRMVTWSHNRAHAEEDCAYHNEEDALQEFENKIHAGIERRRIDAYLASDD